MGYSTDFSGKIMIEPPLTPEQVETINKFCEERHGGPIDLDEGVPGFWCDWETDGQSIYWNGSEKSYSMDKWMRLLIREFFSKWGNVLNGRMLAQGEESGDRWTLDVQNNDVITSSFDLGEVLKITDGKGE